jgi:hypothetical protein
VEFFNKVLIQKPDRLIRIRAEERLLIVVQPKAILAGFRIMMSRQTRTRKQPPKGHGDDEKQNEIKDLVG